MRWTPVVLATLAGLQAAHAHDEDEVPHPNMVLPRLRDVDELRQRRNAFEPWNPPTVANKPRADRVKLSPRQTSSIPLGDNSQCGGTYGRCADGYCCSASGWCGQSEAYCASPDCQINYGPACDGNEKPNGPDTSDYARPKNGNIPYGGVGIYACVNQGDVAITYDDGPYIYTAAMLDAFKAHGAVATWFITGNNIGKGMINVNYRDVITRMIADGHQVASHTWSHENLDQMTLAQRKNQMVYNEIAFMDILGFFPTYMRPPYSICGAECQGQMADLGYHITYFDLDTQGYLHTAADQIGFSVNLWDQAMLARTPCNGSYLHIEHDIHQYIATTLTNHILDSVVSNGWNAVTVGTCLGDPPENWYRGAVPAYNFQITPVSSKVCSSTSSSSSSSTKTSSSTSTSSATSTSTAVSTNGQCGSIVGFTCQGSAYGNCCSGAGWCGSGSVYCGTSCQSKYGTCGSSASNITSSSSSGTSSGRTSSSSSTRNSTSTSTSSSSRTGTSSSSSRTGTSSSGSSSRTSTSSRTGTSSSGSSTRSGSSSSSSSSNTRSSSGSSSGTGTASSSGTGTASASSSAASSTSTLPVSTGGDCGAASGKQCFGSTFGNCCSVYNYCGSTAAHCGTGCQSAFGTCNGTSSASGSSSASGASSSGAASSSGSGSGSGSASASGTSSASAVLPSTSLVSTDGSCGAAAGKSCTGSTFGTCCSVYNYCGTTDAHCGTGCQAGYGSCNGTTAASSSGAAAAGSSSAATRASSVVASGSTTANAAAATNTKISTNGECAGTNGYNCLGSTFGDCCSPYNYCGNTTAHCDTGCQSGFGKCSGTGVNVAVSLNGNCGSTNGGSTCAGSTFGNCCSAYGYCGSTSAFCGTGCQSGYGTCDTSSGSGTTAAASAATSAAASTVKTVTTAGAACGSAANAKCGDGFCCTAFNVCASSKLVLVTNPVCFAVAGCQTSWSSSCA